MTEDAFLANILADPDDDVARLAYADWLMERGRPGDEARAEFIHVQCRLAGRSGSDGGAGWDRWTESVADLAGRPRLEGRQQELLAAHGQEWSGPLRGLADRYEFRRGFVEKVTLTGQAFLKNARQLLALAPVREVRLTGAAGVLRLLAQMPELGQVAGLDLSRNWIGNAGLQILLTSPNLKRLTSLDLSYNQIGLPGAQALARSPVLGQLTNLNLASNGLTLDAVRALTSSPHWGSVRTLNLAGNASVNAQAREFLAGALAGQADPALLRVVLQVSPPLEREYTNAHVRALAERVRDNPSQAVALLNEGLRDGHRKVRAAAAQLLSRLGQPAAQGLPGLVQRLYDHNPNVRANVGPALARLLPGLSAELREWLCVLANPLVAPLTNLRTALESPRLPEPVRRDFAAVCARRGVWRARNAGQADVAPPDLAALPHDPRSLWEAAQGVAALAEQAAVKHLSAGDQQETARRVGRDREYAWLLARLCELLQGVLPPPPPAGVEEPRARSKVRDAAQPKAGAPSGAKSRATSKSTPRRKAPPEPAEWPSPQDEEDEIPF